MTAGSGYAFDQARADRRFWGHIVESAVGAHLVNSAHLDTRVYYWRDGSDEVDFILKRGPCLVAVQVKSGRKSKSLKGMKAFRRKFKPMRSIVVGDQGVPLGEFLSAPVRHWTKTE